MEKVVCPYCYFKMTFDPTDYSPDTAIISECGCCGKRVIWSFKNEVSVNQPERNCLVNGQEHEFVYPQSAVIEKFVEIACRNCDRVKPVNDTDKTSESK